MEPRAAIEVATMVKDTTRVGAPQWSMDPVWSSRVHGDWITKARYIPDLATVCTSSRDKTLALTDLVRGIGCIAGGLVCVRTVRRGQSG